MVESTMPQIPENVAERLNALMRPAGDVKTYAVRAGILAAVADQPSDEMCVAALAYVLANQPFAAWSGPETPADEYPSAPDFKGRDRAAFEELERNRQLPEQVAALGMQIRADRVDVPERARRAWTFLTERCQTPMEKVAALNMMLRDHSPFLDSAALPISFRFNEALPDEEYHGILWRHRATLTRFNSMAVSSEVRTNTALADGILMALSEIADERERAVVFGYYLWLINQKIEGTLETTRALVGLSVPLLGDIVGQIRRAEEQGEPCPVCGKIHGKEKHKNE